jgi:predicted ester cyclase
MGGKMLTRRMMLVCAALPAIGSADLIKSAAAAEGCSAGAETNSKLLDRYVAAVNAHDASSFAEIFTEGYIQHSGRSPSGLAAQVANFEHLLDIWPDIQMRVEDRIVSSDKIAARVTFTATHSRTVAAIPPTGRKISFGTMDIWRVEQGKLAEHWDLVDTPGMLRQLKGE